MRILLIHTGGTIGMAPGPDGLEPQKGLVEQAVLERLPRSSSLDSVVFDPLLDSSNVGPEHWNEILRAIRAHPDSAVIVTHGTDTMAFTGAALSQALAGENRKVVLCGSMLPLGQGGDAEDNLDLALQALKQPDPGVQLAFAGKLMPAAGLVKHHSHQMDAFRSQPQATALPAAKDEFAPLKLAILTLSPGLPAAAIEAALNTLDGAVLRIFGSGTAPDDVELVRVLERAVTKGKRIRAVSQCEAGGLSPGTYAAGAGLWSTGIQNGGAETPEAALIHLWLN
ncbi:asparaginase domain-containing protein [Rhizobium oryzicola]|uniref:Asparaginase domain-containing protein n=1 Tax=Rhizobium oryzicola TaxID=1232668 RepID=A0ABT8T024_9HYPH|nr:asparaginase domain-containing protein [Rhizobium oryzicola]MDO1584057.1 asparaginase domain-containing protein [Rhizobium oryzicola]